MHTRVQVGIICFPIKSQLSILKDLRYIHMINTRVNSMVTIHEIPMPVKLNKSKSPKNGKKGVHEYPINTSI